MKTYLRTPFGKLVPEMKAILVLAAPVILGQLGHMVIQQADTLMIGRLGKVPLGASVLAGSIFFLPIMIGMGITIAISPLVSQAIGAGKRESLGRIFDQGLLVSLIAGVLFSGILLLVAELIPLMNQKPEVIPLAQEYLRIIGLSGIPMLLYLSVKAFADGLEDVMVGTVVMGIMVALNIGLNWLLIFGHWGLPRLGLMGAGYATLISRTLGFLVIWIYVRVHPKYVGARSPRWIPRFDPVESVRLLKLGLPSGMQYFFEVGAFTGATVLMGWIGPDALSAHVIALGIPALTYMVYMGIATAGSIRIGNALGRRNWVDLRRAGMASFLASGICIVVSTVLLLLLYRMIPGWYIDDVEVELLASSLLLVAVIFQIADGLQAVAMGLLRGMEDVNVPMLISFVAYWVIGLPGGYFFLEWSEWGAIGVWIGLSLGLGFSALFLTYRFNHKSRLGNFPDI